MKHTITYILLLGILESILFYHNQLGINVTLFMIPLCIFLYFYLKKNDLIKNKKGFFLLIPILILSITYSIYNNGNNKPENLLDFVDILQQELVRANVLPEDYDFESHKKLVAMQPGDVPVTYADTTALERDFGFKPSTNLRDGLRKFAEWYKMFYCS